MSKRKFLCPLLTLAVSGTIFLAPVGLANAAETEPFNPVSAPENALIKTPAKVTQDVPDAPWHGKQPGMLPLSKIGDVFVMYGADHNGEVPAEDRMDSDGDGVSDFVETNVLGIDPKNIDTDGDGLYDGTEVRIGTNPALPNSDRDDVLKEGLAGLNDFDEVMTYGTNPMVGDTDGDGLYDNEEIFGTVNHAKNSKFNPEWAPGNTNPLSFDTDGDGVYDYIEAGSAPGNGVPVMDPNNKDSDGDGIIDGEEYGGVRILSFDTATNGQQSPNYEDLNKVNAEVFARFGWDENIYNIDNNNNGIPDRKEPQKKLDIDYGISYTEDKPILYAVDIADTDGDGVLDGQDFCPLTPLGTKVGADGCMAKVAAPTLEVADKTITAGDEFDPIKDMVTDHSGGDVKVDNASEVKTDTAGVYDVKFSVTNESGTATKTAKLTVKANVAAPTLEVADKTITAGDAFDPIKDMVTDSAGGEVKVTASEGFDAAKPGEYTFTFTITNEAGTATKTAKLTVSYPAPTLEVVSVKITEGETFDPSSVVKTHTGGDIAYNPSDLSTIEKGVPGDYVLRVRVISPDNQVVTQSARVQIEAKQDPTPEVSAPSLEVEDIKINVGDEFDPKALVKRFSTAPSFDSSDLSKVDTSKPGVYEVKITVTAPDGQKVTKIAKVEVAEVVQTTDPKVEPSASASVKPKVEDSPTQSVGPKVKGKPAKSTKVKPGLPTTGATGGIGLLGLIGASAGALGLWRRKK